VTTTDRRVLDVDLVGPDAYRDGFPHALVGARRDESPVWWHPRAASPRHPEGSEFWAVLGQPEIQEIARSWETFSAQDGVTIWPTAAAHRGHTLVSADPPEHTRLRRLVSAGFTPRMIARLDDLVVQRTAQVLDAAADLGECNFVREVAYQLPMHIIADIVGIPDADRPEVFRWADTAMRSVDPLQGLTVADHEQASGAMFAYAEELGREKRRNPTDDVWSLIAAAEVEDDAGLRSALSPVELDMFFLILSIAGSETTRSVISSGLVALLAHPDQLALLRAEPELIHGAADELIRYTSPVTCHTRRATTDVVLGGQAVRAGDTVAMIFPAANRDPRAFADPDRLDVTRDPNPHVGLGGGGIHYCLGAHLARREIRVMFEQLLARFSDIEIVGPTSSVVGGLEGTVAVSLETLPVRLTAR